MTHKWPWWYGIIVAMVVGAVLRLVQLGSLPQSLYWDELSLGYDAYSLLQTGKDHHGQPWPFPAFYSYGDYKPAGYVYVLVPFIKVFGLTPLAVRLPSALAGVALIGLVGWLTVLFLQEAGEKKSGQAARSAAVIASCITAISPWAVQFSRGGWEVNLACALITAGAVAFLVAMRRQRRWPLILLATLCWAAAAYTYHAARIVGPGLAGLFWLVYLPSDFAKRGKNWLITAFLSLACFFVLLLPLVLQLHQPAVQNRFQETSLLARGGAVALSNYYKEKASNVWWSKLLYHRWLTSVYLVLANASTHFSFRFLFLSGDANLRHGTGFTGIMYLSDVVWLLAATVALSQLGWRRLVLVLGWLAIAIFPAAITDSAPHALRTLLALPVVMLLLAVGVEFASRQLGPRLGRLVLPTFVGVSLMNVLFFGLTYGSLYPYSAAQFWQYGYAQLVPVVAEYRKNHPTTPVSFTREQGRPAMYYWFYAAVDPRLVQAAAPSTPMDQGEFLSFENMHFINSVNEAEPGLVISSQKGYEQLLAQKADLNLLATITLPNGQVVWQVMEWRSGK